MRPRPDPSATPHPPLARLPPQVSLAQAAQACAGKPSKKKRKSLLVKLKEKARHVVPAGSVAKALGPTGPLERAQVFQACQDGVDRDLRLRPYRRIFVKPEERIFDSNGPAA